jgi:DUF1365 family protein
MKRQQFSRLYDCDVTHVRLEPVKNSFRYTYSTFCLDLDEVEGLQGSLFGSLWWNALRFVPTDFIFGSDPKVPLKKAIEAYALQKGVSGIQRIELVAHMRTLGYAFNPAAFYFCYGKNGEVLCAILEVTNTYHEKKAYLIPSHGDVCIQGKQVKEFYISPFVDLDAEFEFKLSAPTDCLRLEINSLKDGKVIVRTVLTGSEVEWSGTALLKRFVRFPLITLQVIAKIHFRAFVLYLKKVPYLKKKDRLELQKGGLS